MNTVKKYKWKTIFYSLKVTKVIFKYTYVNTVKGNTNDKLDIFKFAPSIKQKKTCFFKI